MTEEVSHIYANNPLDRCNNNRATEGYGQQLLDNTATLFIPFWNLKPLLCSVDSGKSIAWKTQAQLPGKDNYISTAVFLGTGTPTHCPSSSSFYAIDVSVLKEEELANTLLSTPGHEFKDLRAAAIGSDIPVDHLGILAQARSMMEWHRKTQFCAKCGGPTEPIETGAKRRCKKCQEKHYPRTDPVVLILVYRGDYLLMSKGKRHPGRMYTCVAGFIEAGESLEEAARREVKEETGVVVGKVKYHSSQPWPFLGGQLMIGVEAEAISDAIHIDPVELEDAQWVHKTEVEKMLNRSLQKDWETIAMKEMVIPPALSLAHQIIKRWVLRSTHSQL